MDSQGEVDKPDGDNKALAAELRRVQNKLVTLSGRITFIGKRGGDTRAHRAEAQLLRARMEELVRQLEA
ncbi:hypothetical protein FN976_07960 [Caenimonas sedimenti]|uniref:Uncharacterized protein n=1 Tax=Caenimonas sedimenti TaxID=2596921 RepID=A0A562ZU76_9BURK|nr:hypothetical protein FN976_07960 [Caenimonas sedimenti]